MSLRKSQGHEMPKYVPEKNFKDTKRQNMSLRKSQGHETQKHVPEKFSRTRKAQQCGKITTIAEILLIHYLNT